MNEFKKETIEVTDKYLKDNEFITGELMSFNPKKRQYIYLAGNINENPATYEWREKFTELMEEEDHVIIVNPCANKFNQAMRGATKDGLAFTKEAVKRSQKILRAKDYQLVKMCSVMVVHLGYTNVEKPMVGTIQELVWGHDIFYTPIIGITNNEDTIYTNHPWIDECLSAKVETVEEAVDMIKTFFLEY